MRYNKKHRERGTYYITKLHSRIQKEDYDSMKRNLRLKRENEEFGIRWLLSQLGIGANAYYNYRKHRNTEYYAQKTEVQKKIDELYHRHNGVDGYRSMTVYLEREGYSYSAATIHKYMNMEMGLHSIVRHKNRGQSRENRIKYSRTGSNRTSMRTSRTRSGTRILPTCL